MSYFFSFLIAIFYLIFCFLYPNLIKEATIDTINTFLKVLLPSILPMYVISNILINNVLFNKLTNKLKFLFRVFDSSKSITLFLTNILVGSPSSVINVINSYKNEEISKSDLIILIKSSSFMNPLFIFTICKIFHFNQLITFYFIITNILINYIILITNKKKPISSFTYKNKLDFLKLLTNSFQMLYNIFIILLFINFLKLPILLIDNKLIQISFSFLEITSGIISINKLNLPFLINIFLIIILLSTNGITICLQVINEIKKVSNSRHLINGFLKSKVYQLVLNLLLFLIFFI